MCNQDAAAGAAAAGSVYNTDDAGNNATPCRGPAAAVAAVDREYACSLCADQMPLMCSQLFSSLLLIQHEDQHKRFVTESTSKYISEDIEVWHTE